MPFEIDYEQAFKDQSMDLGKPPLKHLDHMEFPKVIYNHKRSFGARINLFRDEKNGQITETHIPESIMSKTVASKDELDAALAQGWSEKPPKFETEEVDMATAPLETVKKGRAKAV